MTEPSEAQRLDVYARPFVPQALRDVNEAPANIIPCTPVRWLDFDRYTSTFAGTDFFSTAVPHLQPGPPVSNGHAPLHASEDGPQPENYFNPFGAALAEEAVSQNKQCEEHAMYMTRVMRADPKHDPRPSMYIVNVPGLRELSLRIGVGDVVEMRQIRFNAEGQVESGSVIKDPFGMPIYMPRQHDSQHNAVVWGIDRLRETLILRIDNLKPRSMLFNVKFTAQWKRFQAMRNAVTTAQNALRNDHAWMRSMLFPCASDGYYQKQLNRREHGLDLNDPLLNYEQTRAVSTVVQELYGPVPFIISGPPGTGKTKTMVELALQLLARRLGAHLLVCAPSDPAADTLVQRLSKHLQPSLLLRINSPARNFPEVPTSVLPYCFVDDGMFSLPPFAELMRKAIVVTTCRDAEMLVNARVTNSELCNIERRSFAALHGGGDLGRPRRLHWSGLLIDEAAQATEPEAVIPMTVVSPPDDHDIPDQQLPVCVLAGDQHQLGPRVASAGPEMRTSLFERLLERPFYSEHPLARSKQSGGVMRPLTQDMLPILRPAFANLMRNYRSHPAILATPSKLFYNDTLEPEAAETDSLVSWPEWQGRGWPVLFSCNTAPDEIERDGGGWYNNEEASLACQYAASLAQTNLVAQHDICIMSPFRAQVRVLRKLARTPAFGLQNVNIGPLEAFQGLEKRVVIICTTRTRNRFLDQDLKKGLGVIHEPKRFNVALTRAMHGLIVIGNPSLLEKDDNWKAFLDFCQRHGLWEDRSGNSAAWQADSIAKADAGVSRLERQMVRREDEDVEVEERSRGVRRLGLTRDAESDLWTSGVEAEAALGDEEDEHDAEQQ